MACAAEYKVLVLKRGDSLEDMSIDRVTVNMLKSVSEKREKLPLNLLTTTIVAPPSNASKWQMGFKGLKCWSIFLLAFLFHNMS
jgi:hypothetical protein